MEGSLVEELQKIPPQQIEAEQSLLGGILIDSDGLPTVLEILKGDEFYRDAHRIIFRAFQDLFERNDPVDLVTVAESLASSNQLEAVGGATYLASLAQMVPSAANVGAYAKIVKDKAILRRLIQAANEVTSWAYAGGRSVEQILDSAESTIFAITENTLRSSYYPLKDVLKRTVETIENLHEFQGISGIASHFADLDKLTAGFQRSDLIIVAARPSMGKTAFALNVARNVAVESQVPVGFFSLEMSKDQLAMRLLCAEARVDSQKIRSGFLSSQESVKMIRAASGFSEAPIFIDDTPAITALELRAKARRMMADRGLGLIVVDYLQLMQGRLGSDKREQEISEISRSLKALAKELYIPVIALSQLNRKVEERHDKRPQLSDLRESGAIEQDADVILFLYREEMYNKECADDQKGMAEIIIGKQRNGPQGTVRLAYIKSYTRFENIATGM